MTALFGAADHARLTALRTAHFPPDRNHLDAHLTLFHHLPPSIETELKARLAEEARAKPPPAMLSEVRNLGNGTALSVESPALSAVRERLADAFHGLLTPQDQAGWRPHVTLQNKVTPTEAKMLQAALREAFEPCPLVIAGIGVWRYLGGPWESVSRHAFRG